MFMQQFARKEPENSEGIILKRTSKEIYCVLWESIGVIEYFFLQCVNFHLVIKKLMYKELLTEHRSNVSCQLSLF